MSCSLLSDGLLLKQCLRLMNSLLEEIEVGAISLNFNNWKVNQHACDLRGKLRTNQLCDELKYAGSDCLSVSWVNFSNSSIKRGSFSIKLVRHWVLTLDKLNLNCHLTSCNLRHWHTWHGHTWHWHSSHWHWLRTLLSRHSLLMLLSHLHILIVITAIIL